MLGKGELMGEERIEKGLQVRREVLGPEYVDRALAAADDFTRDWQDWVSENCWGLVWTRPGLERKTRSLLVLAVLTATNHFTELAAHTLGALRNGCTVEEIREVFLQCSVYVGTPAAVEAFRAAQPVISEYRDATKGLSR
jgi:4-carboxymuconolactone decarboxylase